MLTIFSVPKPFAGHVGTIQHNAIRSWLLLNPACEILLLGNELGTSGIAEELGLIHEPEIQWNDFGTPLVNSIFRAAEQAATSELLCYVNCDVILMSDFIGAVERVGRSERPFLMAGQRWNLEINEPLEFGSGWEHELRSRLVERGRLSPPGAIDYLVFPRGFWGEIPPFAVGRAGWDNWMLYKARSRRVPLIDATRAAVVVHQAHDYSHHPEGRKGVFDGEEARRNVELAGGWTHVVFTLQYATHVLTPSGLKRALTPSHILRRLMAVPVLYPLPPVVGVARMLFRVWKGLRPAFASHRTGWDSLEQFQRQ